VLFRSYCRTPCFEDFSARPPTQAFRSVSMWPSGFMATRQMGRGARSGGAKVGGGSLGRSAAARERRTQVVDAAFGSHRRRTERMNGAQHTGTASTTCRITCRANTHIKDTLTDRTRTQTRTQAAAQARAQARQRNWLPLRLGRPGSQPWRTLVRPSAFGDRR
jgi:hypothetical protein